MALVTIILTVYQRTAYLRKAIESVLGQSFRDFEILVTDDSDSAEIRTICGEYAATELVRYRANRPRLGVVGSLKAAMRETQSVYISILNDDDYLSADFLSNLVPALEANPGCAVAFCDMWILGADGSVDTAASEHISNVSGRAFIPPGILENPPSKVIQDYSVPIAIGNVIRAASFNIDDIRAEAGGAYDYWIACLLAATGAPFFYVKERLCFYRVHEAMETLRHDAHTGKDMIFIYNELLEKDFFPVYRSLLESKLSQALFTSGLMQLRYGEHAEARKQFFLALQRGFSLKLLAGIILSFLPRSLVKHMSRLSWGNKPVATS